MPVPEWARKLLGNQTDEHLRTCTERANALQEIENTRGYKLITTRLSQEQAWVKKELESCSLFHFVELQKYNAAIELVLGFIRATNATAQAAIELLSERKDKAKPRSVEDYHQQVFGGK